MLFSETLAVALQAIRANLMRSTLTMLGIIIGVAAVITMVALGSGAQRAIEQQIESMGARLLSIYAGQSFSRGVASGQRVSLRVADAEALARDAFLLSAVVPEIESRLQVKYSNTNINIDVAGATENFPDVLNYEIAYGRMFTAGDDESRKRVAVLGHAVPGMLDANPQALLQQSVTIRGIPFEIIGVLAQQGSSSGWSNPDEQVWIPIQTAQYRVFGSDRLRRISVEAVEGIPLEQAMVDIERVLRREHKIPPGGPNDFRIRGRQEILATQQQATQVFTYLLASIAGVSLLVGGIGIMNIMLVSVTERTREIGVRKALGATRVNILLQFLVEALALCLLGGLLGVLVGVGGAKALAHFAQWNTLVSPGAIILALGFSGAVGVFFGLWPARRAASLDPIEALRYE